MRSTNRLPVCFFALLLLALNPRLAGQNAPAGTAPLPTGTDGAHPSGALVQGTDGNFYGTTSRGSSGAGGTVFQITPAGALKTLHIFTGSPMDGSHPCGGLVQGGDGNFYGTSASGGSVDAGTVFKMTPAGALTVLYSFRADRHPMAGLTQGSDGNFYGTTSAGGIGAVFKITPEGVFTTLHRFTGSDTDGAEPCASLVQGSDGDFYGSTTVSGKYDGPGTIFKITPAGALTALHTFHDRSLGYPGTCAALTQGRDGNFYGTTSAGGIRGGSGTVFKMTPEGAFSVLYRFTDRGAGGRGPLAGLIQGSDGNFYGTASMGGSMGGGTVFKITPAGAFSELASFTDGRAPAARLTQGRDGNFYGTTEQGGIGDAGTIFKITQDGVLTTLYRFTGYDLVSCRKAERMKDACKMQDAWLCRRYYSSVAGG